MVWHLAEQHVQGVGGGEGKDLEHCVVLEGVEIMIRRPGAEASILERLGAEASILRGSGGEAVITRAQRGEVTVTGTQGGEVSEIMRLRGLTGRPGGVATIGNLVEAGADLRERVEAGADIRSFVEARAAIRNSVEAGADNGKLVEAGADVRRSGLEVSIAEWRGSILRRSEAEAVTARMEGGEVMVVGR